MRASGRSTLLMATIGFRPSFSALPTTNWSAASGLQRRRPARARRRPFEDALDLAAEVGVARGVDDVDAGCPSHCTERALGQDGDAALALQIVGVHGALDLRWLSRKVPDCCSSWSTRVVLPWSTWAMMAMLRRFMSCSSGSDNGWSAISPENRDPLFRITLKTWNSEGAHGAQKGSPAKRTGRTLLVASQYSRKTPKNNGLFRIWLAHFCRSLPPQLPFSGSG